MSKINVLEKFNELFQQKMNQEKKSNLSSHIIVGVDVSDVGMPSTSVVMTKGTTYEIIGMCEKLIFDLKKIKKKALDTIEITSSYDFVKDPENKLDKIISNLPEEEQDSIRSIMDEAKEALKNNDSKKLFEIKKKLEDLKFNNRKKMEQENSSEDKEDDFDINDFKGDI